MRWRHTWPGGGRPHDETLFVEDGRAGRSVARVDHAPEAPEDRRWRWFWQASEDGVSETGVCATKEAARAECERRASALS